MTEKTITIIKLGVLGIVGAGVIAQFIVVQSLGITSDSLVEPIDYTPLERVVTLWQDRRPFDIDGDIPPVRNPDEESGEENVDVQESVISISIQNGSGIVGAASSVADALDALTSVSVDQVGNTTDTAVTTVSIKASVSAEAATAIVQIVEDAHGVVTQTILSENADFDVSIILGIVET